MFVHASVMIRAQALVLACVAALPLGGCFRGVPDPVLSARDSEFMALVPTHQVELDFERYEVPYVTDEKPGTIIVHQKERLLHFVLPNGRAIRYGVAVGNEAFGWTGVASVQRMAEWPRWTPPPAMLRRWPHLAPRAGGMEGGPNNPLGAPRALPLPERARHALPHPRHQRAGEHRPAGLLGLHPHAQHRRHRPLQPGEGRREGDRAVAPDAAIPADRVYYNLTLVKVAGK